MRPVTAVVAPVVAIAMQIMPGLMVSGRCRSLTGAVQHVLVRTLARVVHVRAAIHASGGAWMSRVWSNHMMA